MRPSSCSSSLAPDLDPNGNMLCGSAWCPSPPWVRSERLLLDRNRKVGDEHEDGDGDGDGDGSRGSAVTHRGGEGGSEIAFRHT